MQSSYPVRAFNQDHLLEPCLLWWLLLPLLNILTWPSEEKDNQRLLGMIAWMLFAHVSFTDTSSIIKEQLYLALYVFEVHIKHNTSCFVECLIHTFVLNHRCTDLEFALYVFFPTNTNHSLLEYMALYH